jgi:hypothetical protein
MGDTMKSMEIKKVDELVVESLEVGDIIGGGENGIVTISSIIDSADGETFFIDGFNQYDDFVELVYSYGSVVDFYYPVEEEGDD